MSNVAKFRTKKVLLGASIAAATLASGCSTINVESTKKDQMKKLDKAERVIETGMKVRNSDSSIRVSDGYYIAEKPIRLDERDLLPDFFYQKMAFNQKEPVALQELISTISDQYGVRIEFTADAADYMDTYAEDSETEEDDITAEDAMADTELAILEDLISSATTADETAGLPGGGIKFSIKHYGTLSDLLDRVTGRLGLYWEWSNNQISIFRTKTVTIKADINAIEESFSADFSSSSGSQGTQSSSSLSVGYNENQMSSFQEAIQSFLTKDGVVNIMSGLNMIVVKDIPTKVKEVQDFIEQVNTEATTQIAVRLDIITITENDNNDFGLGWDAIFNGSTKYGFEFASQLTNAATPNLKLGFISPTSNLSGSEAFINALREKGLVTKHYTNFGQTSNGRSMPMIDENTRDYISSLSTEVTDSGTLSTDTQVDTAVTGIDINVLPKLTSRNKISMDIKFSVSELVDLEERNFDGNQLQLPQNSNRSTTLSPVLQPGKTYMIGGTINEEEMTGNASITGGEGTFDWMFGGRKESSNKRTQTILLVTPYVLSN
mgnify:CR=1 FL=1